MVERVGKSFADLLNVMQQLTAGMADAKDDPKLTGYSKDLTALFETLRSLDDRQEKAKAELHSTSKELGEKEKEARLLVGKAISFLESEHGKSNQELQRYGISRRQPGPKRKKPETAKTK